jgi:hypothetical protein
VTPVEHAVAMVEAGLTVAAWAAIFLGLVLLWQGPRRPPTL